MFPASDSHADESQPRRLFGSTCSTPPTSQSSAGRVQQSASETAIAAGNTDTPNQLSSSPSFSSLPAETSMQQKAPNSLFNSAKRAQNLRKDSNTPDDASLPSTSKSCYSQHSSASSGLLPGTEHAESGQRARNSLFGNLRQDSDDELAAARRSFERERERQIQLVIEQQAFNQDIIESLARENHERVFGTPSDVDDNQEQERDTASPHNNERPRNLAALEGSPVLNIDGSLTPRGQELINNFHSMMIRTIGEQNMHRLAFGVESPEQEHEEMIDLDMQRLDCEVGRTHAGASNALAPSTPSSSSSSASVARQPHHVAENNPLGWQGTKNSIKERLTYMFNNDTLADVYFTVGKDDTRQRIPAHRFVLSIGSVVFDAMFNGGLTLNLPSSREPMEVDLPDVEPEAFLALLRFLYSDEVEIGPESVMMTLYTAKKYAVPAMEIACVEFLKKMLVADNAFMLLTQARIYDEPQLTELCLEKIDKDTVAAINAECFAEIDHDTLCLVLARDTLRVKEAQLFQAVVNWAGEECLRRDVPATTENKRVVLGEALQLIRFPLMSIEEFAQTAAQSGLLTDRQMVDLFLYFTVNPKPPTSFSAQPRSVMGGKEFLINRFQRIESRWGYSGTPDKIKFTVDHKIYIIGFGLYGSMHGPHDYQVTIQIHSCHSGKLVAYNDTTFRCDGSSGIFRALFKKPVEITPSVTYVASALLKGPDSYYGSKGLRRIVHSTVNNVTFQFAYAAGNNNGTSVEDGQIPEIYFYRGATSN